MAETFIIVTEGGPHPGAVPVDERSFHWPLPGFISDSGGKYVKFWESRGDELPEKGKPYIRHARYRWATDEQLAQDARLQSAASQGG